MDVAVLQDKLVGRAFLHDDPEAYLAGVNDALEVLMPDLTAAEDDEERTARGA